MQLFVRTLRSDTRVLKLDPCCSVECLKQQLQDLEHIPVSSQILVFSGRLLQDTKNLAHYGLEHGSTVHLLARLVGGKGGFGALLRGQGRDGKLTTNFDACRDLSGRRLRHSNAEKKLAEWQALAAEREREKAALHQLKQQAKEEKRTQAVQVNAEAVKDEQRATVQRVQDAVQSALADKKDTDAGAKRKAERDAPSTSAAPVTKRSKMLAMLEDFSSGSDTSDEEN